MSGLTEQSENTISFREERGGRENTVFSSDLRCSLLALFFWVGRERKIGEHEVNNRTRESDSQWTLKGGRSLTMCQEMEVLLAFFIWKHLVSKFRQKKDWKSITHHFHLCSFRRLKEFDRANPNKTSSFVNYLNWIDIVRVVSWPWFCHRKIDPCLG